MSAPETEQPVGAVEMSECPRTRWYEAEGRQLRAEGWKLRTHGDKWNGTHALIERRTAAEKSSAAPPEAWTAFAAAPLCGRCRSERLTKIWTTTKGGWLFQGYDCGECRGKTFLPVRRALNVLISESHEKSE